MKPYLFVACLLLTQLLTAQQEESAAPVYNLEDAVNYAFLNSNTIRNARVDILDAEQNVRERLSTGLPQINATVDYNYYIKVPQLPLPEAFAAHIDRFSAQQ